MGMLTSTRPVPEDYCPPPIADVVARRRRKEKPEHIGFDEFPIYADDPLRDSHVLLDNYLRGVGKRDDAFEAKPASIPAGKAILATAKSTWPRHLRAVIVRLLFRWTHCVKPAEKLGRTQMWGYDFGEDVAALGPLVAALLREIGPELGDDDFAYIMSVRRRDDKGAEDVRGDFGPDDLIAAARAIVAHRGLSPVLRAALAELRQERRECLGWGDRKEQARVHQLDELLGETPVERTQILDRGEPWAEAVLELLQKSGPHGTTWEPLLRHCRDADASKPSGKWLKEAKKQVDAVGAGEFVRRATQWLELAAQPRSRPLTAEQVVYQWRARFDIYSEKNEQALKGLAWACGAAGDPEFAGPLGRLAEWCYSKLRDHGPRSPKVGNACLCALIGLPGQEPRAELSRLKAKVKQPTAKKMIEKALGASAAAAGMTPDDLEELAVTNYGLSEVGRGERKVGAWTAETRVTGTTKVEVTFVDAKGKSRASVPADLKGEDADAVKELQHSAKELGKMLPALRDRLERMPMNRRELPMATWRTRYLDHPVVGTLARRLIWELAPDMKKPDATIAAMWLDGKLVDAGDDPVKKLNEDKTLVRLWHPSTWPGGNVLGWRNFLERHQVTQPFKQAHREVYLLTDAERRTRDHSNRFATHILRQHQFAALCTQRGWRYRLIGSWDGGDNTPTLELPRWNLRAEFWVDAGAAGDVGPSGVATYVTTDQVRFYATHTAAAGKTKSAKSAAQLDAKPLKLEDVPPLAFSEVMRDVDLFVGVTSMGNDPEALPRTDAAGEYWHGFAFGELSETAKTRHAVLERLLPRLKIAPRASLEDKFLVVKGDLRTYRIHLGSSNIQMEPNSQYLCIVPDRGASVRANGSVFLPFEGDQMLSIILSKAFLLAEDAKITDPTIVRQIRA